MIPARTVPEQRLPDGRVLPAQVQEQRVREAQVLEGRRAEQRCQVQRKGSRLVSAVLRAGILRRWRWARCRTRWSCGRPRAGKQGCVPAVLLPAVLAPAVTVPAVNVPATALQARLLDRAPDVEVLDGEDSTAYVTPGDVLFETGSAQLRSAALPAVDAVAAQVRGAPAGAAVTWRATRTTSAATPTTRRGRSGGEADRLVREGVDRSRITVRGLGEIAPTAEGTSADARRRDRRVVVGVDAS